jgi:hypothetical protein
MFAPFIDVTLMPNNLLNNLPNILLNRPRKAKFKEMLPAPMPTALPSA